MMFLAVQCFKLGGIFIYFVDFFHSWFFFLLIDVSDDMFGLVSVAYLILSCSLPIRKYIVKSSCPRTQGVFPFRICERGILVLVWSKKGSFQCLFVILKRSFPFSFFTIFFFFFQTFVSLHHLPIPISSMYIFYICKILVYANWFSKRISGIYTPPLSLKSEISWILFQ